jgi:antitoxin (DNA-binding transcriptional repressor) of toxin-antitoxin stability system
MQTITLEEAQSHLSEIIEKLAPGEEVVLIHDDKPVATIRAIAPSPVSTPRKFGTLKGTILYIAPDFDAIPEGFEDYLPAERE